MKIRNGFVSNSSSSSFICEVCGDTFETWDEGISSFGLVMCEEHDHLFCEDHRVNPNPDGKYSMYESKNDDDRIDSIHCPVCQLKVVTRDLLIEYAMHKLKTNQKDLYKEIRNTFATYNEMRAEIEGNGHEYCIELTAHVRTKAGNKDCAYAHARAEVMKDPVIMLDVTHCE